MEDYKIGTITLVDEKQQLIYVKLENNNGYDVMKAEVLNPYNKITEDNKSLFIGKNIDVFYENEKINKANIK